jgi:O-acetyl-ADP-ribose deacetylase (regulator of RNase III)
LRKVSWSVFDSRCEVLTNTVNTTGAMGAGLALEFRLRIPGLYDAYKKEIERGAIEVGRYWIYSRPNRLGKRILNFPTKRSYQQHSKYDYISLGLDYFAKNYPRSGIKSIAFPVLGTRQGGLEPETVVDMMEAELGELPIEIELCENLLPDAFTSRLKSYLKNTPAVGLSRALRVPPDTAYALKREVRGLNYLSELYSLRNFSLKVVQTVYDFGFKLITTTMMQDHIDGD